MWAGRDALSRGLCQPGAGWGRQVPTLLEAGVWRDEGANPECKELSPVSPQAAVGSLQSGARGGAGMPYASAAVGGRACHGPSPKLLPSLRCAKGQGWGRRESSWD